MSKALKIMPPLRIFPPNYGKFIGKGKETGYKFMNNLLVIEGFYLP